MSDISDNYSGDQIFEIAKNYYESTSDNIIGVGYGYKSKKGEMTDEKCIIFSVQKKLPLSEIDKDEIIPSTIQISSDQLIKTDVVQREYKFLSCSSFLNWQSSPPPNRNKIRPLRGGISITNNTALEDFTGTLGFIARDNQDGCLVGVSNNHVLVDDAFICSERGGSVKTNVVYNEVIQPSELNVNFNNSIGYVKRYFPIRSGLNYVDGALCTLRSADIDINQSYKQYGLSIDNFLPFATTQEIDSLIDNSFDLFSSGRTTGAKGEGNIKLKISQANSIINIEYEKQGAMQVLQFGKCLHFIATLNNIKPYSQTCNFPIAAGDSGSVLIADINGVKKIIGLVFAGSVQNGIVTEGIANRIDEVASKLCISAWNGGLLKFNNNKIKVLTTNSYDDQPCLEHNGEKYWQLGFYENGSDNLESGIFEQNQPKIYAPLSGCWCD
jgi:hypothetical protein